MSARHSPGPWWSTDGGIRNSGGYIVHTNSVQRYEGQDERYVFEVAQREADKRLIASAPDMLKALRRAVLALAFAAESSEAMRDDYNAVSAAISKATGSTS